MDDKQLLRYSRQIMLPEFDIEGQSRLNASHALVIGLGGLGSPAAMYLAAAGIGTLALCDDDEVDLTNLQRQVLFDEQDAADGLPKAEAAKRRIARINSHVRVTAVVDDVNAANVETLALDYIPAPDAIAHDLEVAPGTIVQRAERRLVTRGGAQ